MEINWQQYGHSNSVLEAGIFGGGGKREWPNMLATDVPPIELAALEELSGLNWDSTKLVASPIEDWA